jgi:hypothetical protein
VISDLLLGNKHSETRADEGKRQKAKAEEGRGKEEIEREDSFKQGARTGRPYLEKLYAVRICEE